MVPGSGLCVDCLDGCKGGCEMWLASFRGREVIYPGPFGKITAGADKNYPLDYSHLNIQGYACGTKVEEIFVCYEELKSKFGKEIEKLPLGAIGIYTASQKIRTGLEQLMAGSRTFTFRRSRGAI